MKRGIIFIVIAMLVILIVIPIYTAQSDNNSVTTHLEIGSFPYPPLQIANIPNQTWAKNTNHTDVIRLDDFFIDNTTITYTNSNVQNITIIINQTISTIYDEQTNTTTNITYNYVSFYPDYGFTGIRNVTFTASDGIDETISNIVTLNVTDDNVPPYWTDAEKDTSTVHQNDQVNFSVTWLDNIWLGSYIFSINQGGIWTNYSGNIKGKEALASQRVQISQPEGSIIFWQFFGFDTTGNTNQTTIFNFTVSSGESGTTGGSGGGTSGGTSGGSGSSGGTSGQTGDISGLIPSDINPISDFIIDPEEFLVDIKQGGLITISLKVTNIGNQEITISVANEGLNQLTINQNKELFTIKAGETESVTFDITAPRTLLPDIYFGKIHVTGANITRTAPIVVEVNQFYQVIALSLNVTENSKEIKPGNKVIANITLENIADLDSTQIKLYYAISDYYGLLLDFKEESFILNQRILNIERNLTTTKETLPGDYIFYARAEYNNNVSLDSDTFVIGARFNLAAFIRINIFIIIIILLSISIVIFIIRYRKNQERLKLLRLYLLINELKALLRNNHIEEAVDVYIKIKHYYGEPLSQAAIVNKPQLKKEMELIANRLDTLEKEHPLSTEIPSSDNPSTPDQETNKEKTSTNLKEEKKEDEKDSSIKEKVIIISEKKQDKNETNSKKVIDNKKEKNSHEKPN